MTFDPRKIVTLGALFFFSHGIAAVGVNAANHALLIGIGQYETRILEGPPP